MYAAVLDANVLVPSALCDTLLRLAAAGFYRPLWSEQILREVQHAILRVRPELDAARVKHRIAAMRSAFIDANVEGWETSRPAATCPTTTTGTSSPPR